MFYLPHAPKSSISGHYREFVTDLDSDTGRSSWPNRERYADTNKQIPSHRVICSLALFERTNERTNNIFHVLFSSFNSISNRASAEWLMIPWCRIETTGLVRALDLNPRRIMFELAGVCVGASYVLKSKIFKSSKLNGRETSTEIHPDEPQRWSKYPRFLRSSFKAKMGQSSISREFHFSSFSLFTFRFIVHFYSIFLDSIVRRAVIEWERLSSSV